MPNPTVIHPRTVKLNHYLKLVDLYIHLGCPQVYIPEPNFKEYLPDVYMKDLKGNPICVEVQLTQISSKKMQKKLDQFVSSYGKEHDARILLLVSDSPYKIQVPKGFNVHTIPVPKEVYTM